MISGRHWTYSWRGAKENQGDGTCWCIRSQQYVQWIEFRLMYKNLLYIAMEGLPANGAVLQVLSSPLHMVGILTSGLLGRLWYVLLDVVTIFWPLAKISSQNQCHIPDTCLSIHSPEGCCIAPKDQEVDNPKVSTECNTLLGTCSVGSLEVLIVPVWESNDVKLVHTVSMQMLLKTHYDVIECWRLAIKRLHISTILAS